MNREELAADLARGTPVKSCFHRNRCPMLLLGVCFLILVPARGAWAWTEHPLVIRETLASFPEVQDAGLVKAESLDAFLMAEEKGLVKLLEDEEAWARKGLAWYRPLPEGLRFRATGNARDVRQRFCHAIRINPHARLGLYLQFVPTVPTGEGRSITPDRLTFLKDLTEWKKTRFAELGEGEMVSPSDVVTTASDEPDFGLDIGLYEDNGTAIGTLYGFGKQPFGNPNLEYSSQGPFHMGYYHEAWIVGALAGFVKQTYPEHRIHLYRTLSVHAFRTGHDYWGWRFMGIGLHYLMDMNLPYHSTLLPGVSTPRMLWINTLDLVWVSGPKAGAIQLVSNRHTALEAFQQAVMQEAYRQGHGDDSPLFQSLRTISDCPAWDDRMVRDVITARSNSLAAKADRVVEETLPARWVSDPTFELGTSPELYDVMTVMRREGGDKAVEKATGLLREMLEPLPGYVCSYARGILADASRLPARPE